MNRVIALFVALALVMPVVAANDVGSSVGITMETEQFKPLIWLCGSRILTDDNVEQGRDGTTVLQRNNNYAFEGEQIQWNVLVMDKNGIEKVKDVYVTVGTTQGEGNDIEANCRLADTQPQSTDDIASCNARIGEENVTWNPKLMAMYTCTLTVESPDSMYGEYWVTIEVEDLSGLTNTVDENEYWYLNPVVALNIEGDIDFGTVRPGTTAYSDTLTVGNGADDGSGVILDMFITGTDFTDPTSSGAACPDTNQLSLTNFRYYAVNGAWSTKDVSSAYLTTSGRTLDSEGYLSIPYGDHFDKSLYGKAEILPANPISPVDTYGYAANLLAPGAEMSLTFKLNLPEPCVGDFTDGHIYFWGEAI